MIIERLKPYITTVSELVKTKAHGDVVVVGGEIKQSLFVNASGEDAESNFMGFVHIDDDVGSVFVSIPYQIYQRDKAHLYDGNIVLIKGVVSHLVKHVRGQVREKEYRVVASSVIPLAAVEGGTTK